MPLFTSTRERRLWGATLAVVVAIYATLGVAGTVAGFLRDHGLLAFAFGGGMLAVLVTIVTQGLRVRPRGVEIGVALGVAVAYFMVAVRMAIPEERSHLFEYGVVAVLILEALLERRANRRRVPAPWLLAIVLTTLVGAVDEAIQYVLPNRVFDWQDVVFNTLAAVMAVAASAVLRWAREFPKRNRG